MKTDQRDIWKQQEAEIRRVQTWRPLQLPKAAQAVERRPPTEFGRRPVSDDDELDDVMETKRTNRMQLFMRILGI